jgi:tRNA/rRNA methyltransferase
MIITHPAFILVEPQMGENIGAVARAMLNFGLTDLRIVNPRDGWPNDRAIAMSSGALDKMPPVRVFETLPDAIADLNFVYTTAAFDRFMVKPVMKPTDAAHDMAHRARDGQKIGVIFGRERSGLTNDEIAAGQVLITIPVNEEFASLNLAQASVVIAYEWSKLSIAQFESHTPTGKSFPATIKDFDEFFNRLEGELDIGEFFRVDEMRDMMKRNIRNALLRAEFSDQELKTLHGVVTALTRRRG